MFCLTSASLFKAKSQNAPKINLELAWSVLCGGKEQLEGAWCETAWCLVALTCSCCSRIAQSQLTPLSQQISERKCEPMNFSKGTCKQSWMWQFDCFSLSLDFRTGPVYVWKSSIFFWFLTRHQICHYVKFIHLRYVNRQVEEGVMLLWWCLTYGYRVYTITPLLMHQ